jgi:hypothetical protein
MQSASGATCVNRPAWINVALFALSRRRGYCLALSGIQFLVWWNFADFYVCKRFPDRPEYNDALLISVALFPLLLALIVATRIQIRRGLTRFAEPGLNGKGPETLGEWRAMITEIAGNCDGLSKRYVAWLGDSGYGWRGWVSAAWLPALAVFLASPPLHSGLMGYVSDFSRKTPPSLIDMESEAKAEDFIFGIDNVALSGKDAPVVTGLAFRDGKWNRTPDSKVGTAKKTYLIFAAGDFPHVHRRLEVLGCALPNCSVPPAGGSGPAPVQPKTTCFPTLRRARACFEYWQPLAAYRPLPLNVRVVMRTPWGHALDLVRIE